METELIERARAWIDGDPDPVTRQELTELIDSGDEAALRARMDGSLSFGTAGLRGVVGAGPLRMNRAVVIRTTRGLGDYLLAEVPDAIMRGVVVGFDARPDSEQFARDTLGVLAAMGIRAYRFVTAQPTPLVAYAQKALNAAAAVVVTASHNPPEYNGYKVYADGAAQIVPPTDGAIAAAIDAVGSAVEVVIDDVDTSAHVEVLGGEVVDRYLAELATARPPVAGPDFPIVYTPLHGVGGALVQRALANAGYGQVHVVAEQAEPDGTFPTVAFPNPEEPGAMDLAIRLAAEVDATLILANDPDADRLAVGVRDRDGGGHHLLTGNQIGVLLADHLLRNGDTDRPLLVASIVSTPMLAAVGDAYGAHTEYTLTGFKWICAAARMLEAERGLRFVYGFEEALGSCVGSVVHDKDGIGAAVAFADLSRSLAADGQTVHDRWEELTERHGLWVSHQLSIALPVTAGRAKVEQAMERLGDDHPLTIAGHDVRTTTDFRTAADERPAWLGEHDLIAFDLEDGRVMIRPSGTEPKCKIYVDLRGTREPGEDVVTATARLENEAVRIAADVRRLAGFDADGSTTRPAPG